MTSTAIALASTRLRLRALAKDRREYKKITKNIAQLIKWKGNDTAKSLIEELMQRYPRKPALLDELEKVEKKL